MKCTPINIAAPNIMIEADLPRLSINPQNTGVNISATSAGNPAKVPATFSLMPYLVIISSEANFWKGNTQEQNNTHSKAINQKPGLIRIFFTSLKENFSSSLTVPASSAAAAICISNFLSITEKIKKAIKPPTSNINPNNTGEERPRARAIGIATA